MYRTYLMILISYLMTFPHLSPHLPSIQDTIISRLGQIVIRNELSDLQTYEIILVLYLRMFLFRVPPPFIL